MYHADGLLQDMSACPTTQVRVLRGFEPLLRDAYILASFSRFGGYNQVEGSGCQLRPGSRQESALSSRPLSQGQKPQEMLDLSATLVGDQGIGHVESN